MMKLIPTLLIMLVLVLCMTGILQGKSPDSDDFSTAEPAQGVISLPEVHQEDPNTLTKAIYTRRSVRNFSDEPITIEHIAQLLWAAAGKTVDGISGPTRAYPSAGGIYPLEVFVVADTVDGLDQGVYRYRWDEHALEAVRKGAYHDELTAACLDQGAVDQGAAGIVIAADYESTKAVYGPRGSDRYVPLDAGAAGQNLQLKAVTLGLGSVVIGAFDDEHLQQLLQAPDLQPLLVMPVGRYR